MKQQQKHLFRLLASLTVLLSMMPLLSQAVPKQDFTTLIEVNGVILERQVMPQSSIAISLNAEIPIRTASVMTDDVRCFFIRRVWLKFRDEGSGMAQMPDGTLTHSTISPVFGRNYDLDFMDMNHRYTSLLCYWYPKNAVTILLESYLPDSTVKLSVMPVVLDDKGHFELVVPGDGVRDVLKATLLESQYPSMRCTLGRYKGDENSVEIKLGQPYETNIAQVQYIGCRRG